MTVSAHQASLKIGIFGGAFDPPHWAHRQMAELAIAQLHLDRLYVLPTGQAWHKSRELTHAAHRLAMCELAFSDLERVHIDDREVRRSGPTYTADTLAEFASEFPGAHLFLLLGADQLLAFKTWSRWQDILQKATLVVASRAVQIEADPRTQSDVEHSLRGVDLNFLPLRMPLRNISATAVRTQLQGQGLQLTDLEVLVPEGVARYISQHHLYQNAT